MTDFVHSIYNRDVANKFVASVQSNTNKLAESFAKIITNIKRTKPTDDTIAIQNGTGVSIAQQKEDLADAIRIGEQILQISKLISDAASAAETTKIGGGKYKFIFPNASSVILILTQLKSLISKLESHKKAYSISAIFDQKDGLNTSRRFDNLANLLETYADGDEARMLAEIKKKAELDAHERMVILARRLRRQCLYTEANTLFGLLKRF